MEAVAVTPPTGWNRLAPKTSCGTRERTPTCRGLTDWISDEREAHGRVAASGMGQGAKDSSGNKLHHLRVIARESGRSSNHRIRRGLPPLVLRHLGFLCGQHDLELLLVRHVAACGSGS